MKCIKLISLATLLIMGTSVFAKGHKYALLIGISKYQIGTGWNDINGTNDVDLLKQILTDKKVGFSVTSLKDGNATHANIVSHLESLIKKVRKGDVVYLHFSGHGQAVQDLNNDETDGWDESFIPYDAEKSWSKEYHGKNHLIDDELGKYINRLREKLGQDGMMYVVIDSCHSGTMDRDCINPERGTYDVFTFNDDKYQKEHPMKRDKRTSFPIATNSKYSKIIMLEACGAEETNQEIIINGKYYGPISYSVYVTIVKIGMKASTDWVNNVRNNMKTELKITNHKQRMIDQIAL